MATSSNGGRRRWQDHGIPGANRRVDCGAARSAVCGFDAVYIDLEHNPTSLETAAGVCVAALGMGIMLIARVTSHDPHDATRILDCGTQGVMVPHVQNAAEAKAIVEACLYAPKGHRSAFGSDPQLGYAAIPQAEVCKVLNEQSLLMAMIETPEAVANAGCDRRS